MEENNSKFNRSNIQRLWDEASKKAENSPIGKDYYSELLLKQKQLRAYEREFFSQMIRSLHINENEASQNPRKDLSKSSNKHKNNEDDKSLSRLEELKLSFERKDVQEAVRGSENPKQTLQKINDTQKETEELSKLSDDDKLRIAKGECIDSTGLIIEKLAKARPGLNVEYESLAKKICRNDKKKRQALDIIYGFINDLKELENFITSLQSPMSNASIAEKMLNLMARGDKKRQEEIKGRHIIEAVLLFIPAGIWKDHNVPAVQAQIRKLLGSITKQDRDAAKKKG